MSPVFDLYGLEQASLEEAAASVERALGVELRPHESSYRGGEYMRSGEEAGEHLILQRNYDPLERDWVEPDHRDAPYLLYVNYPDDFERLRGLLEREPGVRRLRHHIR